MIKYRRFFLLRVLVSFESPTLVLLVLINSVDNTFANNNIFTRVNFFFFSRRGGHSNGDCFRGSRQFYFRSRSSDYNGGQDGLHFPQHCATVAAAPDVMWTWLNNRELWIFLFFFCRKLDYVPRGPHSETDIYTCDVCSIWYFEGGKKNRIVIFDITFKYLMIIMQLHKLNLVSFNLV